LGRPGGRNMARVRAKTRASMKGHSSVELGAPGDLREQRLSVLRSAGFELVGVLAILTVAAVTVGLAAFAPTATHGPMVSRETTRSFAQIDTDTSWQTPQTAKRTRPGGVSVSQDSLAKQRDPAAHAPRARPDSAKPHTTPTAPPPSAVVP
jgi:hypothetical protein